MGSASLTLVVLSGGLTLLGLFPCMGWLNWFALPLSMACCVVGIVGLANDKGETPGARRPVGIHTLAVVVGAVLTPIAFIRLGLGGGVL